MEVGEKNQNQNLNGPHTTTRAGPEILKRTNRRIPCRGQTVNNGFLGVHTVSPLANGYASTTSFSIWNFRLQSFRKWRSFEYRL